MWSSWRMFGLWAKRAYDLRGSEHFKLGHIRESVADFDKFFGLKPQASYGNWRRGIVLYYDRAVAQPTKTPPVRTGSKAKKASSKVGTGESVGTRNTRWSMRRTRDRIGQTVFALPPGWRGYTWRWFCPLAAADRRLDEPASASWR
jgi:hypothetical protein